MDTQRLKAFASDFDRYPEGDNLIDVLVSNVPEASKAEALKLVGYLLTGMTEVDIRGLVSVGDEHEWATLALRAFDRSNS